MLFLVEGVGVSEYCCTAVEIGWQLCASRFLREQRLDEPSSQRVRGLAESRQCYVRGVALSQEPPKLQLPLGVWPCGRVGVCLVVG